jgi:hypothetical protein
MKVFIYAFVDPRLPTAIRYVGQARRPNKRRSWHLSAARGGRAGLVYDWMRSVLQDGHVPQMVMLEECDGEPLGNEREKSWVAKLMSEGHALTNRTAGGKGTSGWKHSDATKAAIGAVHRGKAVAPEAVARMIAAKRGKPLSPEHRRNIGNGLRGRKATQATREKIANGKRGNKYALGCKHSEQGRANHRAAVLRGPDAPNARLKRSDVDVILAMSAGGARQADIMRKLGLDRVTVHRVVKGKTYVSAPQRAQR